MVDVLEIKGTIFSVNEPFFDWALNIGSLSNSTVKARLSTWGIKRTHPALRAPLSTWGMKRTHPALWAPLSMSGMRIKYCTPSEAEELTPSRFACHPSARGE